MPLLRYNENRCFFSMGEDDGGNLISRCWDEADGQLELLVE